LSEVKTFRISCSVKFGFRELPVVKEVRALTREEALEKFYSEVGSNHKLKRKQLKNISIEEIKLEEVKSQSLKILLELVESYG
jgi:large subunit ribosomal protein LX